MSTYDFSSPTPFLRCKSDGEEKIINKNNIISISETGYHPNGQKGDFVEIRYDYKSTVSFIYFKGKISDLNKYLEPFYL